jgi:hypothetical protein
MGKQVGLKLEAVVNVPDDFRLLPSNYTNARVYFIVTNDDIRCATILKADIRVVTPKPSKQTSQVKSRT